MSRAWDRESRNLPVSTVAEDICVKRKGAVQGAVNDGSDEVECRTLIPLHGRSEVTLSTLLYLLVERLNLIVIFLQDNVPPRKALYSELEGLRRGSDYDHLVDWSKK